ncbi:MAG: tetratricopeptide repeat protein [Deltaproteobacteria bacterium]|nr:tetratricopeptide repeat protein [Deltaproteobacteria bacterium]
MAAQTDLKSAENVSETEAPGDDADSVDNHTEVSSDLEEGDDANGSEDAEPEPETPEERARLASAAFASGNEAYNREDYAAASEQYRKAYELRPNWKLQYNIGQCEALLKRHGLALLAFERYLSEGGDDMSAERRAEVTAEVERLRTLVGYLDVIAHDGQAVMVDGIYRGDAPLSGTIPVAVAVEHEVMVGMEEGRSVVVHGGQTVTVNFKTDGAPTDVEESDEGMSASTEIDEAGGLSLDTAGDRNSDSSVAGAAENRLKATGITLVATGGVAFLTGVITGAVALKKNSFLKDHCE